jgi:hypothetical protein
LGFVRSACGELRNSELFEETLKHNNGNVDGHELKAQLEFLSGFDDTCEGDFSVFAFHFCELSVSDFDGWGLSNLEAILSDPRLVVRDEESVFEVVHRRASVDSSYFGLLEYVRFEYLSGG